MPSADRPAVLGGRPVRPEGPPDWPVDEGEVAAVLTRLTQTRDWGRYHGPHCEQLGAALREYVGCRHAILCCSGTAAVELALRGVGVGAGDEVLMAAYDFKANFTDLLALGALPVLVDVRSDDAQLDVGRLEAACTERTRAVIASHLHGGMVDMPSLREWADRRRIGVIEDCCQSHGATLHGRPAGRWGDAGVLSFGGSKLLSAGRGGAILTDNDAIAQRIRLHVQRGNDAYPLSELQAAVLLPQLNRLPERHRRRASFVERLRARLSGGAGLRAFPLPSATCSAAYYKLGFWYNRIEFGGLPRERFVAAMRAEGIAIDAGFRAVHCIHARNRFRAADSLECAALADERIVQLHHPVLLGSDDDLGQIVQAVEKVRAFASDLATPV